MVKPMKKIFWHSEGVKEKAVEFSAGWDNKPKEPYDDELIPYEIEADIVYARELLQQGYITKKEFDAIEKGLKELEKEFSAGELTVVGYEDVHSLIELKLDEKYGEAVGNMHIGKSRNDQIVTIMRMWMRGHSKELKKEIENFIAVLNAEIEKKGSLTIPGYTHYRVAMPTTYGELLKSYVAPLIRDANKLEQWFQDYNECPLGSGAAFGSTVKLNRARLAKELGFDRATSSTIDPITNRWEAEASFAFALCNTLNHLSTIAQDLIYLSSTGIDVITLPKEFCTGSSIMPQKQNPDVLEVIKAKAAVSNGILQSLLELGKGNISGYNRNTQWTKYLIMDLVREFDNLFEVLSGFVEGVVVNENKSKELLSAGKAYAAKEIADKALKSKKSFRKEKLEYEKDLKKK
jgi:argininosuccinate lyase